MLQNHVTNITIQLTNETTVTNKLPPTPYTPFSPSYTSAPPPSSATPKAGACASNLKDSSAIGVKDPGPGAKAPSSSPRTTYSAYSGGAVSLHGKSTVSTTWITELQAGRSADFTIAVLLPAIILAPPSPGTTVNEESKSPFLQKVNESARVFKTTLS